MLMCYSIASAQNICNGTWSSPVINLTFGQGNNTDNWYGPLQDYAPGVSTSTTFVGLAGPGNSGLEDGYSGLVKTPVTGRPEWVSHTDHTGNSNGLMFLINAPSTAATVFFEYTMSNLCPNTSMRLSVWVLNADSYTVQATTCGASTQYPNLTLQIIDPKTNTILGVSSTGNVPLDEAWHQYSVDFNNGNNSSVKLQVINNSVGSGCGNDLALDDITVQLCQPVSLLLPRLDTIIYQNDSLPMTAEVMDDNDVFRNKEYRWEYSTDSGVNWLPLTQPEPDSLYTFHGIALGFYWVRYIVGSEGQTDRPYCVAYSEPSKISVLPISSKIDSVVVSTQNDVPPQINTMPGSLQLTAKVYPLATANPQVTWSIVPEDGMATIDANGLLNPVSGGGVWAKATSVANPKKSDSIFVTICSSKFSFSVYPNPVRDKLNIDISVPCNADIYAPPKVFVCNYVYPAVAQIFSQSTGALVLSQTLLPGTKNISVNELASGVYYIQINAALYQSRVKFIKK